MDEPDNTTDQPNIHDMLTQAHTTAQGMFKHTSDLIRQVDGIGAEIYKLAKMGDNVTAEDVIEAMGTLVAQGNDPMQMASTLADMPQGGVALASWVQQHAQQYENVKQHVEAMHAMARHELGTSALRVMAGHHGELVGAQAHPEFASPAVQPMPDNGEAAPSNPLSATVH